MTEPMTYELAQKQRLDIYTVTAAQLTPFLVSMRAAGRECTPFKHTIARFELQMVAVGKRPDEGQIAGGMKKLKSARQVIQEE